MNTGEHDECPGGRGVHDEPNDHNPELTELRERLADGLAQARLTQKQLVARTGLGRTTVSEALSPKGPVPSARTAGEIARVLKLPEREWLKLRRDAAGEGQHESEERSRSGRPIGEWDPLYQTLDTLIRCRLRPLIFLPASIPWLDSATFAEVFTL